MSVPLDSPASYPRIFGAPHRYVQGPDALDRMGLYVQELGRSPLLVCDATVFALIGGRLQSACGAVDIQLHWVTIDGDVTQETVERCMAVVAEHKYDPDMIIAAGGGKGIDIGKAIARRLNHPLLVVPTVASNDGATSTSIVMYDTNHRLLRVERLKRNPDFVVVDTALLIKAPKHFLLAGIGDALAKRYEGCQATASCGVNGFGGASSLAAQHLALLCDNAIRSHAWAALTAHDLGVLNNAYEDLIEALVLLSGLSFENTGLSIAHALTRGLLLVPGVRDVSHGLQVAYGLMVQFVLEQRDEQFMEQQRAFYHQVGLPTSLRQLGALQIDEGVLQAIATGTVTAPHLRHFTRPIAAADLVQAMAVLEGVNHECQ